MPILKDGLVGYTNQFKINVRLCCVLVLLIHQKRALWVTKLVPIKGVEEQLNVCNHVACCWPLMLINL